MLRNDANLVQDLVRRHLRPPRPITFLFIARATIQVVATIALFVSFVILVVAVFLPEWQLVEMPETGQYHKHGLWLECIAPHHRYQEPYLNSEFACTYRKDGQPGEPLNGQEPHLGRPYQRATLGLLAFSLVLSFIAIWFSCCVGCSRICACAWTITIILAALFSSIGIIVYTKFAREPMNMLLLQTTSNAEAKLGDAYWHAVKGSGGLWIAAILAGFETFLVFYHFRNLANRSHVAADSYYQDVPPATTVMPPPLQISYSNNLQSTSFWKNSLQYLNFEVPEVRKQNYYHATPTLPRNTPV